MSSTCDVAQWVEHSAVNRIVTGSTPVDATNGRGAKPRGPTPRHACNACSRPGPGSLQRGRSAPEPPGPRQDRRRSGQGPETGTTTGSQRAGPERFRPLPCPALRHPCPLDPAPAPGHGAERFRTFRPSGHHTCRPRGPQHIEIKKEIASCDDDLNEPERRKRHANS